jgi:UDP-4-amino-4,6-dideoxy-N-acetyl-beta-L-altrosamine transaminase
MISIRKIRLSVTEQLAIQGGLPVRQSMLPYGHHSVDQDDIQAVVQVLQSDWLTTGPAVQGFEEAFAAYVGAKHAVAVSSGTAALHAAAFAAGIGPGAEVITTPMTFAASANCVRYVGGDVKFADVRPDTMNIDPGEIQRCLTSRTRAIVVVDYTGQPCDLEEINALATTHGLTVIEDAAHALGSTYRGCKVGSLAPLTTFSLHPVKHVTTGEGGVITTDDFFLAERLRQFRNHGITTDHQKRQMMGSWFYEIEFLGFNYRLTDIQCALGASQLKKLPVWLTRRRDIAATYTAALSQMPELEPPTILEDRESAWHLYVLRLNLDRLTADRADIFHALRAENIGVNVHYIPLPWHPYYRRLGFEPSHWPVAEESYERMLTLPLWPAMSDSDVQDVITAIKKVVEAYRK